MAIYLTTSWDDGHPNDFKIADLLSKYNLTGTFYISPYNHERAVLNTKQILTLSKLFEIGGHTLSHQYLDKLSRSEIKDEITRGKELLEQIIQKPVLWFAYPGGKYNRFIRNMVSSCGYTGARTTRFYHFAVPKDIFQTHTSIITYPLNNFIMVRHMIFRNNLKYLHFHSKLYSRHLPWRDYVCELFDHLYLQQADKMIFHLWGHSWEIEQNSLWEDLEYIFCHISGREDVRYIVNSKIGLL